MLHRHRVALSLISSSAQPINRIVLTKYLFLIAKEGGLGAGTSFYEFLPYKYGAYSFSMARDLLTLERYGYITGDENSVWLRPGMEDTVKAAVDKTPNMLRAVVASVVSKYQQMSQAELLRFAYEKYPEFTFRSKLRELVPPEGIEPAPAPIGIYTLGYEGRSVDGFFDILLQNGVRKIVDVRANPVSRKYGFAGSTLSRIAGKLRIGYLHLPELGISSRDRKGLDTTVSRRDLLDDYEDRTLPNRLDAKKAAMAAIQSEPSALVCMEENPKDCHRGRLAKALSSESGLPVIHF